MNSTICLIDGKPHRACDCETEVCARYRDLRTMSTAGFNRCLVPANDVFITHCPQGRVCESTPSGCLRRLGGECHAAPQGYDATKPGVMTGTRPAAVAPFLALASALATLRRMEQECADDFLRGEYHGLVLLLEIVQMAVGVPNQLDGMASAGGDRG